MRRTQSHRHHHHSADTQNNRAGTNPVGVRGMVAAGLLTALTWWATIPYGSAADWAQLLLCVLMGAVIMVLIALRPDAASGTPIPTRVAGMASALFLWTLLQLLPVPSVLLKIFTPFNGSVHATIPLGHFSSVALDRWTALNTIACYILYGLLTWTAAASLRHRYDLFALAIGAVILGTFQSMFAIFAFNPAAAGNNPFLSNRLIGTFSGSNTLGGFLALTIPISFAALLYGTFATQNQLRNSRSRLRMLTTSAGKGYLLLGVIALLLTLVAQVIALVDSGSRGAAIATVAGLACLLPAVARYLLQQRRPGQLLLTMAVVVVLVLLGSGLGRWMLASRLHEVVAQVGDLSRYRIWLSTLSVLAAHPWGIGLGGMPMALPHFHPARLGATTVDHAHNDYLEILAELGLPGFVLLVWLGLGLWREVRNRGRAVSIEHGLGLLRQGFVAAVVAGLLHATVEFNLSSRPGVAILFLASLSASLAAPINAWARRRKTNEDPDTVVAAIPRQIFAQDDALPGMDTCAEETSTGAPDHFHADRDPGTPPPPPRFALAMAGLLAVSLGGWAIANLRMTIDTDRICAAAGGRTSTHFWLSPSTDSARTNLAQRVELAARTHDPAALYHLAAVWYMLHDRSVQEAAAAAVAREPQRSKAEVLPLIQLGLRAEEAAALDRAMTLARRSIARSPWHNRAHAVQAEILCRQAALAPTPEEHDRNIREALDALERSVILAKHCAETLQVCANILSRMLADNRIPTQEMDRARSNLIAWGMDALQQELRDRQPVLAAWQRANLAIEDMPQLVNAIPAEVLVERYQQCVRRYELGTASSLLAMLKSRLGDATPVIEPLDLAAEQGRLQLLTGAWADYRAGEDSRAAILARAMRNATAPLTPSISDDTHYLWLRNKARETGLDPESCIDFLQSAVRIGRLDEVNQELLALALRPVNRHPAAISLSAVAKLVPQDSIVFQLWKAMASVRSQAHLDAMHRLSGLAANDLIPYRMRHRIMLLAAYCEGNLLLRAQQQTHLLQALDFCDSDAEVLAALVALGMGRTPLPHNKDQTVLDKMAEVTPPFGISTLFLGGKIELMGFDLVPANGSLLPKLTLFWRFWGDVHPVLSVDVAFRDPDGSDRMSTRTVFGNLFPQTFSSGRPIMGAVCAQTVPIDIEGRQADILAIELRGENGCLVRTTEMLERVEIHGWQRYIRAALPVTGDRAPAVALTTAGMTPAEADALQQQLTVVCPGLVFAGTNTLPAAYRLDLHVGQPDPDSGIAPERLGPDGFLLRTSGSHVRICGASAAAVGHAAARWLQEICGTSMLLPDPLFACAPPPRDRLVPPRFLIAQPAHALRLLGRWSWPSNTNRTDQAWALANGLSTESAPAIDHALHRILPPDAYYEQHRDWYPLINGERHKPANQDWQPCFADPSLSRQLTQYTVAYFAEHPDRDMVSLSINDSTNWCACTGCRDLIPPPQRNDDPSLSWWSQPYWTAVQACASALATRHPDKHIGALAYVNVERPPVGQLSPNITVFVCQDASAYFDSGFYQRDVDRLRDWARSGAMLGRYGYAGLTSWIFPRYCRDELVRDARNTAALGIPAVYQVGYWLPWLDGPLQWIVARTLWDPALDPATLQREFCEQAFGPAGAAMNAYFDFLHEVWIGQPKGRWFDGLHSIGNQARRYPAPVRDRMQALLTDARRQIRDESVFLQRIDAVSAPLVVSFAFAREADLVRALEQAASSRRTPPPGLQQELQAASADRRQVMAAQRHQPWFPAFQQQIAAGNTLERWDRLVDSLSGVPHRTDAGKEPPRNAGTAH